MIPIFAPVTFLIQVGDFIIPFYQKLNRKTSGVVLSKTYAMPFDLNALSNDDIAVLCENPDIRVNSTEVGRGISKLSNDIAVKLRLEITDEEVANQKFAYEYSLKSDLTVPKIYRFFRIDNKAIS